MKNKDKWLATNIYIALADMVSEKTKNNARRLSLSDVDVLKDVVFSLFEINDKYQEEECMGTEEPSETETLRLRAQMAETEKCETIRARDDWRDIAKSFEIEKVELCEELRSIQKRYDKLCVKHGDTLEWNSKLYKKLEAVKYWAKKEKVDCDDDWPFCCDSCRAKFYEKSLRNILEIIG